MKIYSVQVARIDEASKEYKRIQRRQEVNGIIHGDAAYLSPEYALGIALKWNVIGTGDLYESKTHAHKVAARLNRAGRSEFGTHTSIVYFVVEQYVIKGEGR